MSCATTIVYTGTEALRLFEGMGGIDFIVRPGMRVVINRTCLWQKPDDAATTHLSVIQAIAALVQKAARFPYVDSPGGPYNTSSLRRVYSMTGMEEAADQTGGS